MNISKTDDFNQSLSAQKNNKTDSRSEMELQMGNSSEETIPDGGNHGKETDSEKLNVISRTVIGIRYCLYNFLVRNMKYVKYIFHAGLQVLMASYLAAAIIIYNTKGIYLYFRKTKKTVPSRIEQVNKFQSRKSFTIFEAFPNDTEVNWIALAGVGIGVTTYRQGLLLIYLSQRESFIMKYESECFDNKVVPYRKISSRMTESFIHGHDIEYWKGLGLLIILYCLLYGSLFYYFVLKRCCGSKFTNYIVSPTRKWSGYIWRIKFFRWTISLAPIILLTVYLCLDFDRNQKKFMSLTGIAVFTIFGFIFSKNPGRVQWRPVFTGLILQFVFGLIIIKWDVGSSVLQHFSNHASNFLNFTYNGTAFVYGPLVSDSFVYAYDSIFAFSALPVIFFVSFFVNILSYYNALQWFILKFGWIVHLVMGTTVCESVNAAANIFIGATESLLLFKHHIKDLTKSELHAIMCGGWSTVAGTVLAAYISFGISPSHLIAASVMSAPASLSYSKLFYPETQESKTTFENIALVREEGNNVLDAACRGAISSLALVGNIIATLIAFLAFIAFLDSIVNWGGILVGFPELSFQFFLTKMFVPISFIMGVDDESVEDVALLMGTKTFVNEFRAYQLMKTMKHKFSPRTEAIATYALCGFSNFSSIGIFLGVISALELSQTPQAIEVATRAFIAANIVCCLTACVAGTLMDV